MHSAIADRHTGGSIKTVDFRCTAVSASLWRGDRLLSICRSPSNQSQKTKYTYISVFVAVKTRHQVQYSMSLLRSANSTPIVSRRVYVSVRRQLWYWISLKPSHWLSYWYSFPTGILYEIAYETSIGDVIDDVTWLWSQTRDVTIFKVGAPFMVVTDSLHNWGSRLTYRQVDNPSSSGISVTGLSVMTGRASGNLRT